MKVDLAISSLQEVLNLIYQRYEVISSRSQLLFVPHLSYQYHTEIGELFIMMLANMAPSVSLISFQT
jgi:hypothetical protein